MHSRSIDQSRSGSSEEMVAALEKVQSFSAEKCLTAFSSGRMAVDYLKIYERLLTDTLR
jgi:hypothetical protein